MRAPRLFLLASALLLCARLCAAAPAAAEQDAALKAATAWLAILDTGDYGRAASGFAEEWYATLVNLPTQAQKVQSTTAILFQSRYSLGINSPYTVVRKLQPDGVKYLRSCQCGIRDGEFFTFAYELKFAWTERVLRGIRFTRQAHEVLYMLQEKDGTWKPVALFTKAIGGFGH